MAAYILYILRINGSQFFCENRVVTSESKHKTNLLFTKDKVFYFNEICLTGINALPMN